MATAEVSSKVVEVRTDVVQISLDKDECAALMVILDRVGGHPNTTPRGKIDGIRHAMERAAVTAYPGEFYNAVAENTARLDRDRGLNSIYFADEPSDG